MLIFIQILSARMECSRKVLNTKDTVGAAIMGLQNGYSKENVEHSRQPEIQALQI